MTEVQLKALMNWMEALIELQTTRVQYILRGNQQPKDIAVNERARFEEVWESFGFETPNR
jgi:hypothetical protein